MPDITQADIAAVQRLKEHQGKCPDEATLTTVLQVAFAAHRTAAAEAAKAEATRAERERIIRRLRDKAAIKRVVAKHEGEIAGAELSDEDRALKTAESYALTQAANEIELLSAKPVTIDKEPRQ